MKQKLSPPSVLKSELDYITQSTPKGTPMVLLVTVLFLLTFWGNVNHTLLVSWAAAVVGTCIAAWWIYRHYWSQTWSYKANQRWVKLVLLRYFISGVLWGIPGWFFLMPDDFMRSLMLVFTICAIAVGSKFPTLGLRWAYFVFLIPCVSPLVLRLLTLGDPQFVWLAILFVFVVASLIHSATITQKYKEQRVLALKANREKSQFIAGASHDLRQPLHSLGFFISALEQQFKEREQQFKDTSNLDLFNNINSSLADMNKLVDSILDISKLDASGFDVSLQHFSLAVTLNKLQQTFQPLADKKSLQLSFQTSDHIAYSDPAILERILGNLLDNAIRYTQQGHIKLTVTPLDEHLIIAVSDTGPGIPEQLHGRLFNEFERGNAQATGHQDGLGLGLAIVKRLSDLLGADIHFDSSSQQGARFSVSVAEGDASKVQQSPPQLIDQIPGWQLSNTRALIASNALNEQQQSLLQSWNVETIEIDAPASDSESQQHVLQEQLANAHFVFISHTDLPQFDLLAHNNKLIVVTSGTNSSETASPYQVQASISPIKLRRLLFEVQQNNRAHG